MAAKSPVACATCGGSTNDKCCAVCRTGYCSKECQVRQRLTHKKFCKDIQLENVLKRTTELVQQSYFKFREDTWNPDIIKVELQGNDIVMYDNAESNDKVLYRSFPNHMVTDPHLKAAVLFVNTCNQPLVHIYQLLKQLTQGK